MSDPVKIHVTFSDEDAAETGYAGESVWAKRHDSATNAIPNTGLYTIDNIPFWATRFGFGDVVLCDESDPQRIPEFVEVVERRDAKHGVIVFTDGTHRDVQAAILTELKEAGADLERANDHACVFTVVSEKSRAVEVILDARNLIGQLRYQFS